GNKTSFVNNIGQGSGWAGHPNLKQDGGAFKSVLRRNQSREGRHATICAEDACECLPGRAGDFDGQPGERRFGRGAKEDEPGCHGDKQDGSCCQEGASSVHNGLVSTHATTRTPPRRHGREELKNSIRLRAGLRLSETSKPTKAEVAC